MPVPGLYRLDNRIKRNVSKLRYTDQKPRSKKAYNSQLHRAPFRRNVV